jgi:hypothetical protein
MIRHAGKIGRDGIVGTDPSMTSRSQRDSKMLGVSDIYLATGRFSPYPDRRIFHMRRFAWLSTSEQPLTALSVRVRPNKA